MIMNLKWLIVLGVVLIFMASWLDSLIFELSWKAYIYGCLMEVICFLAGICVGYVWVRK